MLGLQPTPTRIEVFVYLAYAIPMALYVLWPTRLRRRRAARGAGAPGRPRPDRGLSTASAAAR